MQKISSKATALNQVASTFTCGRFDFNSAYILDYGCGRGLSHDYVPAHYNRSQVFLYDPHWGKDGRADYTIFCLNDTYRFRKHIITCNNVLNVLDTNTLHYVIYALLSFGELTRSDIIFKIYEGDKSGIGRITKNDCYQRNEYTIDYFNKIKAAAIYNGNYTYIIKRKGLFITCEYF